jgi:hypothetical protein
MAMPATVNALASRLGGPGVGISTMAATAKSSITAPIYFAPAARPMSTPRRTARRGAGACSNPINAASASTTSGARMKMRACPVTSGVAAVTAAAKAARSGSQSCELERREDQKPAGQGAAEPSDFDHGLRILRLHDETGALRQLDHQEGMKIIGASCRDCLNLGVFIADSSERKIDRAERRSDRNYGKQESGQCGPSNTPMHDRARAADPPIGP